MSFANIRISTHSDEGYKTLEKISKMFKKSLEETDTEMIVRLDDFLSTNKGAFGPYTFDIIERLKKDVVCVMYQKNDSGTYTEFEVGAIGSTDNCQFYLTFRCDGLPKEYFQDFIWLLRKISVHCHVDFKYVDLAKNIFINTCPQWNHDYYYVTCPGRIYQCYQTKMLLLEDLKIKKLIPDLPYDTLASVDKMLKIYKGNWYAGEFLSDFSLFDYR